MIRQAYHKEMSLGEWSQMFRDIYFPSQNYGRSEYELFVHLVKVFGAGSHHLFRSHEPKASREYIAKIFAWYCALSNRLQLNLEDVLWQKYPLVCPRCLKSKCECVEPPAEIDWEKLSVISLESASHRPETLRDWQIMFASIYRGPSGKVRVPPSRDRIALVFARMAEELGEIAEALSHDAIVDADAGSVIANEMADFGAWIFGLANNLHHVDANSQGVTLADVAWELYPGKCHRCGEDVCICVRGTYGLELAEKGAMGPSHWDEGTGLANKKALQRYIKSAASAYGAGNYTWSAIFLDLDNFGAVNKQHGHSVGDEVLRRVAERIKGSIGERGVVFRRGGEEFVAVVRLAHEPAIVAAEQIRRAIAGEPVKAQLDDDALSVTVSASLGVASCLSDVTNPLELEVAAEKRARQAKAAGKNRVVPEPTDDMLMKYLRF